MSDSLTTSDLFLSARPPAISCSASCACHEATLRGNYLRQRHGRDYRRGEREQLLGVSEAPLGPPSPRAEAGPRCTPGWWETPWPPHGEGGGEASPSVLSGVRCCFAPSMSTSILLVAPQKLAPQCLSELEGVRNC